MASLITAKRNLEIYSNLSELVFGHEYAKKVLINIINRSKLRYFKKWHLQESVDDLHISNCLLIGSSGTGKTHLVESLSKVMKFPLLRLDATELNPTGAHGGTKREDIYEKIQSCAAEAIKEFPNIYFSVDGVMDQMVIFVDEIDKLASEFSNGSWNKHVQSNFLTIFENKHEFAGVTFIFAGAFSSLNYHKNNKSNLGFLNYYEETANDYDLEAKIIRYGLLPELVGRLNHIVVLEDFNEKHYNSIFNSMILPKIQVQLVHYGISDFNIPETKLLEMIKQTMKNKLGVRGLENAVRKLTVDLEFSPPENNLELL